MGVIIDEKEFDQFVGNETPFSLHECWAWDLMMHYAVVRFFEIWGKGKITEIYRGIAGNSKNVQSSISGMIGGTLYNKNLVGKDGSGKFFPQVWKEIYPEIIRWPAEGIDAAKKLAYSLIGNDDK